MLAASTMVLPDPACPIPRSAHGRTDLRHAVHLRVAGRSVREGDGQPSGSHSASGTLTAPQNALETHPQRKFASREIYPGASTDSDTQSCRPCVKTRRFAVPISESSATQSASGASTGCFQRRPTSESRISRPLRRGRRGQRRSSHRIRKQQSCVFSPAALSVRLSALPAVQFR